MGSIAEVWPCRGPNPWFWSMTRANSVIWCFSILIVYYMSTFDRMPGPPPLHATGWMLDLTRHSLLMLRWTRSGSGSLPQLSIFTSNTQIYFSYFEWCLPSGYGKTCSAPVRWQSGLITEGASETILLRKSPQLLWIYRWWFLMVIVTVHRGNENDDLIKMRTRARKNWSGT